MAESTPCPDMGASGAGGRKVAFGVNYEGHKITEYALAHGAVCALNVQVAMDAPFDGDVADEATRAVGRSEQQFAGYRHSAMLCGIQTALSQLRATCLARGATVLFVQVARGRSAKAFFDDSIAPNLPSDLPHQAWFGYKSGDFFVPPEGNVRFGFVNFGMFARLSGGVRPGEVFTCVEGTPVTRDENGHLCVDRWIRSRPGVEVAQVVAGHEQALILTAGLPAIRLLGIADDMPFVTPEAYTKADLLAMFSQGSP